MDELERSSKALIKELDRVLAYGREKIELSKKERPFSIVFCGSFSTGKSSLINALLGCSLPTGMTPVTKMITRLRYGPQERLFLENLLTGQSRELPVAQFNQYATTFRPDDIQNEVLVLELPLNFLKRGVIISDTPGFNDDAEQKLDEMTMREIREADFCIVNFACNKFATMDERDFFAKIQDLTNGNFVSVLNCLNYLQQEGQFEALNSRAQDIIKGYGNERIGYGKYFIIDSSPGEIWLDGLDEWLDTLLRDHAGVIKQDTPLSMAMSELKTASGRADAFLNLINKERERLKAKNSGSIRDQQRNISAYINERRALFERERTAVMGQLDAALSFIPSIVNQCALIPSTFVEEIIKELEKRFLPIAVNTARNITGSDNYKLREKFKKCIKRITVPEPEYVVHKRGFLDIDRYRYGSTYRQYNNFRDNAVQTLRNDLFPVLRAQTDIWFDEQIQTLRKNGHAPVSGKWEKGIEQADEITEAVSGKMLDANMLRQEIRKLRDSRLHYMGW